MTKLEKQKLTKDKLSIIENKVDIFLREEQDKLQSYEERIEELFKLSKITLENLDILMKKKETINKLNTECSYVN